MSARTNALRKPCPEPDGNRETPTIRVERIDLGESFREAVKRNLQIGRNASILSEKKGEGSKK
jgi:hypothetical protein